MPSPALQAFAWLVVALVAVGLIHAWRRGGRW